MGAGRVVMTMAVLAIGAGGLLAVATIPALAPYQQRKPDRESMPIYAPKVQTAPDSAPASGYGTSPPQANADSELHVGLRDGAVVIELPRWAQDSQEWMTLGRRAWREWIVPGADQYTASSDERRYGRSGRREHNEPGGLGPDQGAGQAYDPPEYGPASNRRVREDDQDDYGDQERRPLEEPLRPGDPDADWQDSLARSADVAARAAERARQAARDVRAARGVQ